MHEKEQSLDGLSSAEDSEFAEPSEDPDYELQCSSSPNRRSGFVRIRMVTRCTLPKCGKENMHGFQTPWCRELPFPTRAVEVGFGIRDAAAVGAAVCNQCLLGMPPATASYIKREMEM